MKHVGKLFNADVLVNAKVERRNGWTREVDFKNARAIGDALVKHVPPILRFLLPRNGKEIFDPIEGPRDEDVIDAQIERIEITVIYKE